MIESVLGLLRDPRIVAGAALLLLILVILAVGRHMYRRFRKSRMPDLQITEAGVIKPGYSTGAGYFLFQIVNTQGGRAEIQEIELVLADSGASNKARKLQSGKVSDKYDFVVRLRSDRRQFKLAPPGERNQKKVLARAEANKYRIRLESDEYYWYRFWVRVKWRDIRNTEMRVAQCLDHYIEFTVV